MQPPQVNFPQVAYQIKIMGINTAEFANAIKQITDTFFKKYQWQLRTSKNEKYTAITVVTTIDSEHQLKDYYAKVKQVKGFKLSI